MPRANRPGPARLAPAKRATAKPAPAAAAKAPANPRPLPAPRERGLVAVAEVARPHGIAGELRLKIYNPGSDLLRKRPPVLLRLPDGTERPAHLTAAREADKALLVRIEGVDDRDAAEALRGAEVCVPRASLPPPEEGEFYAWDLEGASVVLAAGEAVGKVVELLTYPTCEVLVVTRTDGSRLEVPILAAYVNRIDAASGIVELATLDGLD
jgi:16S rRNA processing protein RimM